MLGLLAAVNFIERSRVILVDRSCLSLLGLQSSNRELSKSFHVY